MVESQVAMFLFGVAVAYFSVLGYVWLNTWGDRRADRRKSRGRAYWDAILEEDKRNREREALWKGYEEETFSDHLCAYCWDEEHHICGGGTFDPTCVCCVETAKLWGMKL